MSILIAPVDEARFRQLAVVDQRAFGASIPDEELDTIVSAFDLSRFRVAIDDGEVVGGGGSYAFDLTLPGGAQLPMSGVTWVSVAATHRRRGILVQIMEALHADAEDRDEPLVGLTASEGGIYERFGYGVATRVHSTSIDRRQVAFKNDAPVPPGTVKLIDPRDHIDVLLERWARYCPGQVGALTRSTDYEREHLGSFKKDELLTAALHDDGYAMWTIDPKWNDGDPQHVLTIWDFVAVTPGAHLDLWKTIMRTDLIGEIKSFRAVAPDDALPHLITDARRIRTTDNRDGLWLRVDDVARAFGARSYRVDDNLVLGVGDNRYRVGSDGAAATNDDADLVLDPTALGPMLLGSVPVSTLARAGRIEARSPELLARGDVLFGWAPLAHLRTPF